MKTLSLVLAAFVFLTFQEARAEYTRISGQCQFSQATPLGNQGLMLQMRYTYLSRVGIPATDSRQQQNSVLLFQNQNLVRRAVVSRVRVDTRVVMAVGTFQFWADSKIKLPNGDFKGFYTDGVHTDPSMDCKLSTLFFY